MAIADLTYREFNFNRERDNDLEKLITEAGRDEVFAFAAANGWSTANPPEKWVWRQLAHEVLRRKAEANTAP